MRLLGWAWVTGADGVRMPVTTRAGSGTWTEMGSPLIHSCVHGARKQVTKSSERVRLEKHDLMGRLSKGS